MVGAMAAVRSAMLTGLGMAALALAGEAPSPLPGRSASQAPGTIRKASRVPEPGMGEEAGGGRDPFVRPTASGSRRPVEVRPSGLSGLAVDEAILRGVVTSRDGRLAVLEGPDGRAWVARPGERLHDGTVQGITANEVLFLRDAADSIPSPERMEGRRLRDGESAR